MEIRRHVMKGLIPLTALMLLASACSGGEDLDQKARTRVRRPRAPPI